MAIFKQVNFEDAARYCCLAMVLGLSLSTAGANIALLGFLIFGALSRKWIVEFHALRSNQVVQVSLALFAFLCLSVSWSSADAGVAWAWVSKHKKLLLIPLMMPFFQEARYKLVFVKTLLLSLSIGIAISYLNYLGYTSVGNCPQLGCSGHSYITLSILTCLLYIISVIGAFSIKDIRLKIIFASLAVFAFIDVGFILPSRTGQILLLLLTAWLPFAVFKGSVYYRRKWAAGLIAALVISSAFTVIYNQKSSRLVETIQRIGEHRADAFMSSSGNVSADVRFEFYRKSFKLIAAKPLLGWGAGGQEPELLSLSLEGASEQERVAFSNPHNEYILWAMQTGFFGLLIFLWWVFTVWRCALRVSNGTERNILLGWLILFTLGNCLNSFLLDFSEGYMTVMLIAVLIPLREKPVCSGDPLATSAPRAFS